MEMCGRQSIVIAAVVRCVVGVGVACNYCLHFSVERFAVTRSGVHQLTANTPTHLEVTAVQCVKVSPHLSSHWLEFE